ncbi:MAG: hypothetical protein Q8O26_16445 [Phreatobacter sp.]|uniref:hypothetical protein n=1 Tax=Phreatobacter sp. TaxID=1966341 RepID=UPI0027362DC5|nr:hypothetical protein [Phreatobacter sp.]MDP2803462.1 hypothetical protein [Phreatobacter sp.]
MLDVVRQDSTTALTPERLRAANIHPDTRLATDYLNHFNEVIMLLELVPTMPDCVDDVLAWQPASYQQHFIRSHYRDKDLVLQAFAEAPVGSRRRFLALVAEMDTVMLDTIAQLSSHAGTPMAGYIAEEASDRLKHLAARTSGVMNAVIEDDEGDGASAQDAIDALMTR